MASKTDAGAMKAAENDEKIRKSRRAKAREEQRQRDLAEHKKAIRPRSIRRANAEAKTVKMGYPGNSPDYVMARDIGNAAVGDTEDKYGINAKYGKRILGEARAKEGRDKKFAMDFGEGYGSRGMNFTGYRTGGGFKKGGPITEKATGERYASKAAMKKHEAKETKTEQKREVWDKPNPKAKSTPLSPAKKATAKATAKKAGRPYPNLVDNMRAAKGKSK